MTRDFICVGHLKSGITYLRNFCHVFSSITVFFHCINTLLNQMQAIIEISSIEFKSDLKNLDLLYSLDSNNVNVVDNLGKTIITRPIPAPGSAAII